MSTDDVTDWRAQARCRTWLSEAAGSREVARAKEVCAYCPVRRQCLVTALQEEVGFGRKRRYGIRGGQSVNGRIALQPTLAALQAALGGPVR